MVKERKLSMLLHVENLRKIYGTKYNPTVALDGIDFFVDEGEFVGIMGASGSGKSTLLNCISTIDMPSEGKIVLDGKDVSKLKDSETAAFRRNNLGFIFQESKLLDTLTVEENIFLPLTIQRKQYDIHNKVKKIIEQLGIDDILMKFPYEISGGQKQRCAAARAIIANPKLILADEPTGALDSAAANSLMLTLEKLNKTNLSTILLVTHDPISASFTNRVLFLKDGKIFHEIMKGEKNNIDFYNDIVNVLSFLGGRGN